MNSQQATAPDRRGTAALVFAHSSSSMFSVVRIKPSTSYAQSLHRKYALVKRPPENVKGLDYLVIVKTEIPPSNSHACLSI